MKRKIVSYLLILPVLLIFINRGLFVSSAYEIDSQGGGEVNTLIELVALLVTGECNAIDEDGDEQSNFHFAKIVQLDFFRQSMQCVLPVRVYVKKIFELEIPGKEDIPKENYCSQIEYPPEGRRV